MRRDRRQRGGELGLVEAERITPRVDQHEANQQARIDAGVASGQLTRREARRLEREQAKIHAAERHAKADGVVTPQERRHLELLQKQASANIHAQKHDAQVAHGRKRPRRARARLVVERPRRCAARRRTGRCP